VLFPVEIHGKTLSSSQDIKAGDGHWSVPEELPVAFVYNRRNYAVMMGTPDDLADFALGFSLTEGVVKSAAEVKSLDIHLSKQGVDLRFKIAENALERLDVTQRRRNMIGSASCGLCGLENVDELFKVLPVVAKTRMVLSEEAMRRAIKELRENQPLNLQTHSVHAAAWVNLSGDIQIIREDVGRHNALDKLLGAMAMKETILKEMSPKDGFVLMSSRCSYEIVEKAARRGVKAILSISGPTAFAIRKAKEANMALYARTGEQPIALD